MRMAAQCASIEAGAVHLPINAPWLDKFKKEILAFPTSQHDDQVDALSQALQRANAPRRPHPSSAGTGALQSIALMMREFCLQDQMEESPRRR
jgi:hypothetical protein